MTESLATAAARAPARFRLKFNALECMLLNTVKTYSDAAVAAASTSAAVTAKLITGFVSGAGVVAASDTILAAINKLDGNQIAGSANSAIIGKVLTGFVSGAGTVAAADTILAAINKLDGNQIAGSANSAIIGKVLTGAVAAFGKVAATDSILAAFNKVIGNSMAVQTTSAAGVVTIAGMTSGGAVVVSGLEATALVAYAVCGTGEITVYDAANTGLNAKKVGIKVLTLS